LTPVTFISSVDCDLFVKLNVLGKFSVGIIHSCSYFRKPEVQLTFDCWVIFTLVVMADIFGLILCRHKPVQTPSNLHGKSYRVIQGQEEA
jgi:hypothetical protein